MPLRIAKDDQENYQIMSDIMRGMYETPALVEFLTYYQNYQPDLSDLHSFLKAIKKTAAFSINTNHFDKPVIDISGTGGDQLNTVNISSLAGVFAAATKLVKVAKYGNRAATSLCGSMDVLEGLGISIDLSSDQIHHRLTTKGFSPLFARNVYPGARHVADARKLVSGPTLFNTLFPLARPLVGFPRFLFGVANQSHLKRITQLSQSHPQTRALIVHGLNGIDEVSTTGSGISEYYLVNKGRLKHGFINVQSLFKIESTDLKMLQVQTREEAILLFNQACDPEHNSPKLQAIRNAVMANAAMALFVGVDEGTDLNSTSYLFNIVKDTFKSGQVKSLLQSLREDKTL